MFTSSTSSTSSPKKETSKEKHSKRPGKKERNLAKIQQELKVKKETCREKHSKRPGKREREFAKLLQEQKSVVPEPTQILVDPNVVTYASVTKKGELSKQKEECKLIPVSSTVSTDAILVVSTCKPLVQQVLNKEDEEKKLNEFLQGLTKRRENRRKMHGRERKDEEKKKVCGECVDIHAFLLANVPKKMELRRSLGEIEVKIAEHREEVACLQKEFEDQEANKVLLTNAKKSLEAMELLLKDKAEELKEHKLVLQKINTLCDKNIKALMSIGEKADTVKEVKTFVDPRFANRDMPPSEPVDEEEAEYLRSFNLLTLKKRGITCPELKVERLCEESESDESEDDEEVVQSMQDMLSDLLTQKETLLAEKTKLQRRKKEAIDRKAILDADRTKLQEDRNNLQDEVKKYEAKKTMTVRLMLQTEKKVEGKETSKEYLARKELQQQLKDSSQKEMRKLREEREKFLLKNKGKPLPKHLSDMWTINNFQVREKIVEELPEKKRMLESEGVIFNQQKNAIIEALSCLERETNCKVCFDEIPASLRNPDVHIRTFFMQLEKLGLKKVFIDILGVKSWNFEEVSEAIRNLIIAGRTEWLLSPMEVYEVYCAEKEYEHILLKNECAKFYSEFADFVSTLTILQQETIDFMIDGVSLLDSSEPEVELSRRIAKLGFTGGSVEDVCLFILVEYCFMGTMDVDVVFARQKSLIAGVFAPKVQIESVSGTSIVVEQEVIEVKSSFKERYQRRCKLLKEKKQEFTKKILSTTKENGGFSLPRQSYTKMWKMAKRELKCKVVF